VKKACGGCGEAENKQGWMVTGAGEDACGPSTKGFVEWKCQL
jgi:hypothetical protein